MRFYIDLNARPTTCNARREYHGAGRSKGLERQEERAMRLRRDGLGPVRVDHRDEDEPAGQILPGEGLELAAG